MVLSFIIPSTLPRKAKDKEADVLADATLARKLSMQLEPVEYATELSQMLLSHAVSMEALYKEFQEKTRKGVSEDKEYRKLYKAYNEKAAWFENAKAGQLIDLRLI